MHLDESLSRAATAGRDARYPLWLDASKGVPRPDAARFDSAVIRGNGVSALVCASRLARSEAYRDRVVVAARRNPETPKLINGCTLRARSLDYYAAALGISSDRILDVLFRGQAARAATRRQFFSLFAAADDGHIEPVRMAEFMRRKKNEAVYAYGSRNARLVETLAELSEPFGLRWSDGPSDSLDDCRKLAPGPHPFVINGSHIPLEGAPANAGPQSFVVAWQCAMKRGRSDRMPAEASLLAGVAHASGTDIGVFYPFADPLTPQADAYGLFYRIVDSGPGFRKEDAIAEMRRTVLGVADSIGWVPVDEAQTAAGALVPGFSWDAVPQPLDDYFDLHRTFSAGLPIITGDGMARAGLAGWIAAEAILRGEPPAPAVNRSLERWRKLNRSFCATMRDRSGLTPAILSRIPGLALRWRANKPDTWARVAATA